MGDIHNRKGKLEGTVKQLQQSNLSERNKELLQEYKYYLEAEKKSVSRVQRYISSFNAMQNSIDFDLDKAERKDLLQLTSKINRNEIKEKDLSPYTLAEYRKALKSFYKWHTGEEEPDIVDFITTGVSKRNEPDIQFEELPRPKEVEQIMEAMQNPRDKAFIVLLWECGGRISEVLNLKWKDFTEYEDYCKLKFRNSKTKQRSVPVKECVTLLKNWKNHHKNPEYEEYIFTRLESLEQVSYRGMKKQLDSAVESLDLPEYKRTNFHAFRKSRATFLASKGWNVFQIMKFFGWDKPETALQYIKLAQSNIEEAFLNLYRQTQLDEYEQDEEEEEELQEEMQYFILSRGDASEPGNKATI